MAETTEGRVVRMYPEGGIAAGPKKSFCIVPTAGDKKRAGIAAARKANPPAERKPHG